MNDNVPEDFGANGVHVRIVTEEQIETIAADAEAFSESLTEDIALSKETIAARNRVFVATVISIIVMNSTIKNFKFLGIEVEFSDGIQRLEYFVALVTLALTLHYGAAAYSEYISEHVTRKKRTKGILIHLETIRLVFGDLEDRRQKLKDNHSPRGVSDRIKLMQLIETVDALQEKLFEIEKHNKIAITYSVLIPLVTIFFVISLMFLSVFEWRGLQS